MSANPKQQLDRLIRARYPVIEIVSHEERRVAEAVATIAQAQAKEFFVWTASRGIRNMTPEAEPGDEHEIGIENPIPALEWFVGYGTTHDDPDGTPAILLAKDLHPFFQDPVVLRCVRDLASDLVTSTRTLVILSPALEIPPDCQKDIAAMDWPLPTEAELRTVLQDSIDNLPGSIPIDLNGDGSKERVVKALRGLTAFEAESVLALAVISTGKLDAGAVDFILEEKRRIVAQSGAIEYFPASQSYDDVGGLDLLKAYARQRENAFTSAAQSYGVEPPRGLLLVGIPGCGKSLTAKAIAGGRRPLLRLDIGSLMGSLVGQSEANLRSALKIAEAIAPAILWIDEIEKGFAGAGASGNLDSGVTKRVFGTMLTWMQENQAPVYVVATANDVSALPPELLRRFDDIFFVDLPDYQARQEIWNIHLAKRNRAPANYDLAALADASEGRTGSEIENAVKAALFLGFSEGGREIGNDDLIAALDAAIPLSITMAEKLTAIKEWASRRARPASSTQKLTAPTTKAARKLEV